MLHIGTETTCTDFNHLVFKFAKFSGQFTQFESFFEGDGSQTLIGRKACETRFVVTFAIADLDHRTITADFHTHRLTTVGIIAEIALADASFIAFGQHGVDLGLQISIESANEVRPIFGSFCHEVEIMLDIGREVVVHNGGELVHQEVIHHDTDVRGNEFTAVAAVILTALLGSDVVAREGDDGNGARFAFILTTAHIFARLNGRDGRRVGRRAADAEFFEFMHERGFAVTRRG